MSAYMFRSSRPDRWIQPRPFCDAYQRYLTYGPIRPMEEQRTGFFAWILGLR